MKKNLLIWLLFLCCIILVWCCNHKDSQYYPTNDFYNMKSNWSLHILSHYKSFQQTEEYSCGCAAVLSVFDCYWIDGYDEMSICESIWASELTWTSPDWIISFIDEIWLKHFNHTGDDNHFSTPEDFEDYIIVKIDSWFVTLVDWLDWWWHWQVIIWIDTMGTEDVYDDVLIMADPYDTTDHNQDWYYVVPLARFFYMWEEGSFTETKYKQPFITIFPMW